MPKEFDTWQYFDPDDLTSHRFTFDIPGHKKAVASLAYSFAQDLANSLRSIGKAVTTDMVLEYYNDYFSFFNLHNKDDYKIKRVRR